MRERERDRVGVKVSGAKRLLEQSSGNRNPNLRNLRSMFNVKKMLLGFYWGVLRKYKGNQKLPTG